MIAIALVTLGRAAAIYPCCLVFSRSSLARHAGNINTSCSGAACEEQWRLLLPLDFPRKFH